MALRSRIVSRRYQIGKRIATGDRSEVYQATSEGLGGVWALKRLKGMPGEDLDARLVREAGAAASLDHPNVVELVDAGQSQGHHVLVTELIEGLTLAECIEGLARSTRRLPVSAALGIAAEIARGLAHVHGRSLPDGTPFAIVHRHLCPENVVLSRSGAIKLMDFGSATFLDHGPSEPGLVLPVTRYTAPEQARGESVDSAADLFSLGAILFQLLAGEPLYPEQSPGVLGSQLAAGAFVPVAGRVPELEFDLIRLLEESTHPTRESRIASARNFERRLDQFRAARGMSFDSSELKALVGGLEAVALSSRPNPAGGPLEGLQLEFPPEHVPDTSDLELPNRESVGPPGPAGPAPRRKARMERLVRQPQPDLPRLPTLPRPRVQASKRDLLGWVLLGVAAVSLVLLIVAILGK